MPGLVPGIHAFLPAQGKTWMAGTSPAMTSVHTDDLTGLFADLPACPAPLAKIF
jgi:hypothetical protein